VKGCVCVGGGGEDIVAHQHCTVAALSIEIQYSSAMLPLTVSGVQLSKGLVRVLAH
jgi:hypothetical protein